MVVAASVYLVVSMLDPYRLRVRGRVGSAQKVSIPDAIGDAAVTTGQREPSGWIESISSLGQKAIKAERPELARQLEKAGIRNRRASNIYYLASIICLLIPAGATLSFGVVNQLPFSITLLSSSAAAAIGVLSPRLWLFSAIRNYQTQLSNALPDFLDLMTVCVEAGMSTQESIRRVSEELLLVHPVLSSELMIVRKDIDLGTTVDQALRRLGNRTDSDDLRSLSAFLKESQRFGTNIAEALRCHADMLRVRREQAAEESAQKAAVKILLPTILLIFPATFVVIVGPAAIQIYESFTSQ